jgi:uncharacterized membrane protein
MTAAARPFRQAFIRFNPFAEFHSGIPESTDPLFKGLSRFPLRVVGFSFKAAPGGAAKRGVTMARRPAKQAATPIVDDRGLAFAVYILYFVGYLTGITSIIGVTIAYFQQYSAGPELSSHYTFQVRTFWIGVIFLVAGGLLFVSGIGVLILVAGFFWSLVRNVRGVLALNRNEPIAKPNSWLFGD